MSRVLFIEADLRNEKLGIMYVSAALKQHGHETMLCRYDLDNVNACIESFRPDFLAFSATTGMHTTLFSIAARLKQQYGIKTIFGGPHATFFGTEIPQEIADFVVIGQGEQAIVDIVEGKAAGRMVQYPFMNLDKIPFPDRELFYRIGDFRDNPMKNIITCRDCPYSCAYCYNHSWKKKFKTEHYFLQKRSVANVIQEARLLKEKYLLEKILFIDDNFLLNKDWVIEFCQQYKKEICLPFLCSFSLNLLSEDILKRLKDAGLFMVNFALESADPVVQKEVLHRSHISNAQIIKAIDLLNKNGIKSRMQNMIGLPLEDSLGDALNTLAFNKKHKVQDSWVSIFQPYPNTALAEYTLQEGYCANIENSYAESFFDCTHLKIAFPEKINRLQKWWYYIVNYDISMADVHRLLEIPLTESVAKRMQDLRYEFSKKYLYDISSGSSLEHDWKKTETVSFDKPGRGVFMPLIKKYKLCNMLASILLDILPSADFSPETFAGKDEEAVMNTADMQLGESV